jgi:clan AA aspartic protease
MITGVITPDREAVFRLVVRGPQGQEQRVEAVIDTGFNGFLTLPHPLVAALQLVFHSRALATLGDGSTVALRKYEATVLWEGQDRDVLVLESAGGSLAGMSLLYGSRMTLDIVDGGPLTIEALP